MVYGNHQHVAIISLGLKAPDLFVWFYISRRHICKNIISPPTSLRARLILHVHEIDRFIDNDLHAHETVSSANAQERKLELLS